MTKNTVPRITDVNDTITIVVGSVYARSPSKWWVILSAMENMIGALYRH
jgi:hypothetical protein